MARPVARKGTDNTLALDAMRQLTIEWTTTPAYARRSRQRA
jgi:hypothetical protein